MSLEQNSEEKEDKSEGKSKEGEGTKFKSTKIKKIWKDPSVSSDDEVNDLFTCWKEFSIKPSKVTIFSEFSSQILWSILYDSFDIKETHINKNTEVIPDDEGFLYNTKYLIRINSNLYLSFFEFDTMGDPNESFSSNMSIYYDQTKLNTEDINELLLTLQSCMLSSSQEATNKYSLNVNSSGQLELSTFDNYCNYESDLELDDLYKNSTIKKMRKLSKRVKKKKRGLHIICGERGTGKTNYLNNIISSFSKKVIFVPIMMFDQVLNNLEFNDFMNSHRNSVLIIDDCEAYFNKIHQNSNIYVNTILQMLDSITSNNINVILCMNCEKSSIDENLLDCNHIRSLVEFSKISSKKATKISKKVGKNKKFNSPVKLSKIFNKKQKSDVKKYL